MKECLQCKKEFKPLRESNKFCSNYCRVKWHRANPKPKTKEEKVTEVKLQVLYNSLLEMVTKVSATFPEDYKNVTKIGIMKSNGEVESLPWDKPKHKIKRSKEYFEKIIINGGCNDPEDHRVFIQEVNESDLHPKIKSDLILASRTTQS